MRAHFGYILERSSQCFISRNYHLIDITVHSETSCESVGNLEEIEIHFNLDVRKENLLKIRCSVTYKVNVLLNILQCV